MWRSVVKPLAKSVASSVTWGGGEEYLPFSPLSLSPLAWARSSISTLYQDSAGTTPVTGAGQDVGLREDQSGNSADFTQATATARPTYEGDRLEYDVDDALSCTLPAISGGQIVIISPAGTWIDDFDFAGGTFTVGPDTYTGGPAGLMSLLGNEEIEIIILPTPMTEAEQAKMVSYAQGLGSAGLIMAGSQLVTNGGFSSATGWTLIGAATISGGVGTTTSGGGWRTAVSLTAGKHYLVEFEVVRYVAGNAAPAFTGGTTVLGGTIAGLGKFSQIMTADIGNTMLQISTGGGSNLDIDNVSVHEVILP